MQSAAYGLSTDRLTPHPFNLCSNAGSTPTIRLHLFSKDNQRQSMIPSLGHKAVFQLYNDPKQTSKMTTALLKKLRVKVMDWLSMTPNLNAIEHPEMEGGRAQGL